MSQVVRPSVVTPQTRRYISGALGIVFLIMFAAWEVINYWTTEAGATMMMGFSRAEVGWWLASPGWWIRWLALAMVGLDVFHLVIFFIDRLVPDIVPEEANLLTWFAWGIVTLADVTFSIYTFGYQFETGVAAGTTRGPQIFAGFLSYAPFIVAFMTWGMTFFMVSAGRSFLASAFGLPSRPRVPKLYIPRPGGTTQAPPPPPKGGPQPQPKPQGQPFRQPSVRGGGPEPDPETQAMLDAFRGAPSDGGKPFHPVGGGK